MSATIDQQPQHQPDPEESGPGTDPVVLLLVGIVVVLVLGAAGYLCVVHRSLAGPIGAVGGVASALAAAFGVALALRRR
ncbi:hypothetical protein ADK53_33985 [Streptomyces sp. WM6373]|uniref:hypothetical protein n=1 Tax=Streptomyces sp. WM6373 TaxID=1415556 RepID=UPI0006B0508D|nr:hypothetical protein [Streptomyces sp. WM6373]KOU28530.1 hypothetical protein ADK53_33985 [Streptomyces sp. WM6373]